MAMIDWTDIYTFDIEIDETYGHCEVPAKCNVTYECADPDLGEVAGISIEIISVRFNSLILSRDDLIKMTSRADVESTEAWLVDNHHACDFAD